MALRTGDIKVSAYQEALQVAVRLKRYLIEMRDFMKEHAISGNAIVALHEELMRAYQTFARIRGVPGMAAFAKDQHHDANYDVLAELSALLTAIYNAGVPENSLAGWIIQRWNSDNYLTFSTAGVATRAYSPAETATLREKMQLVIDAIG